MPRDSSSSVLTFGLPFGGDVVFGFLYENYLAVSVIRELQKLRPFSSCSSYLKPADLTDC
jgi:hypothetical protein